MKIFDMHIHARATEPKPDEMLKSMSEAGVFGGCVFSHHPPTKNTTGGTSFDERLEEVLGWARGHEDRIFPVIWIHPYEENIIENVRRAVDAGVAAFKMICEDFYVYEEQPMAVIREIARLGKPVIFHSGILWDGQVSSSYNRPLNFEALINIEGLKFSMGHCSWPWIDECVALYGKFLNALTENKSAEMFFDITPGTPEIYRRELFEKLYNVGYNSGDNIMFGTDANADGYRAEWTSSWLKLDGSILDKLGVSLENREKLYNKNLMRFLGKSDEVVEKEAPVPDDTHVWSPENPEVKDIIAKWYGRLAFKKCYDEEFKKALSRTKISDAITLKNYDLKCEDGKRNLLSFLFFCEATEKKYKELGICEDILMDTLSDIPIWTREWSCVKGELYLGELAWLYGALNATRFKLGRLQYAFGKALDSDDMIGLTKGDKIIEVHIPAVGKLTPEACLGSLDMAREFFKKHFPDYDYKCFTCHSWLLDEKLNEYLPEDSNIIKFGRLFTKIHDEDSNALIRYLFRWDTTEANIQFAVPNTSFAGKIKKAVMRGECFHETLGYIKKQ